MFGFLPITNLKRFSISQSLRPNRILTQDTFDPVATYKAVKATGKYNFQEAKIQLPSKVNFTLFEYLCKDYWDYNLSYFIKFGFPLSLHHEFDSQISPFMTRNKSDSDNRRVIIDLSWPERASINHFTQSNVYLNTVYK